MVYFKTNWIRESNQWVIRKVRPVRSFKIKISLILIVGMGLRIWVFISPFHLI